jgi:hypothetical protein
MVRPTIKQLQLTFGILSLLSTALHLLIRVEDNVENDVSIYIQRQQQLPNFQRIQKLTSLRSAANRIDTSEVDSGVSNTTGISVTESVISSKSENKQIKHSESTNNQDPIESKTPQLYWNLSCPLEQSMFSGSHMEGEYLTRATKAHEIAKEALSRVEDMDWNSLENRRIFFVGDSLLRQVFISMACLSWDRVTNYAVPWYEKRPVRTSQPNTIGSGPHSKFEEGRVQMRGNIELIFHHGIGGLLELGSEYQSHDPDSWLKACYMKSPFTTMVPRFPKNDKERLALSTLNVERDRLLVNPSDIVLINASVHGGLRDYNLRNIADLFKCKKQMQHSDDSWPTMMYVMTGPSHFPTDTGAFEKELLDNDDVHECRQDSTFRGYQDDEVKSMKDHMPILGQESLDLEYKSGDLHVGGKDCLHWLQPGIPDLVAASITGILSSSMLLKQ